MTKQTTATATAAKRSNSKPAGYSVELAVKTKSLTWDETNSTFVTVTSIFIEGDSPTAASVLAHLHRHRLQRQWGNAIVSIYQFQPRPVTRVTK